MKISRWLVVCVMLLSVSSLLASPKRWSDEIDVPYKKFTLPNGLRLIVHEDHKAPMVAVNIWYHVGSKNERPGRTGFAHLFEHLMFNGSKNYNDDYFKALDKAGVTSINGSTGFDRTNYYQVMPTSSLDTVLWMESDRMGHLVEALDQKKLDEQRGVVQNEKRQREGEPYGKVYELLYRYSYPGDHPYSWVPIGSMEDLNAATLDDVREWFRSYYGAANAVISIAGDVDAQAVHKKVEAYFGWIPSGPPIARPAKWISPRTQSRRITVQDRVPLARVYKYWNIPDLRDPSLEDLNLFSDVLAAGKSSRLYQRLVVRDQVASDVGASISEGEIGSQFEIVATAKEGQPLSKLEAALDDELTRILKKGITDKELENKKVQYNAMTIRALEKIGTYAGKAELLVRGEVFHEDPLHFKKELDAIQAMSAKSVIQTARRWLSQGDLTLAVLPFSEGISGKDSVDRSRIPYAKEFQLRDFPAFGRKTLPNGMKLVLLERRQTPIVDMNLVVDGGYVAEVGFPRGTARMSTSLLTEGTEKLDSLAFNDRLEKIATSVSSSIVLTNASVRLSTIRRSLDEAMKLYADAILRPGFRQEDRERIQRAMLSDLAYEKSGPNSIALRVLPKLFYGESHPYAIPGSGMSDEAALRAITEKDLRGFYERTFRPDRATLIVVGDFESEDMVKRVQSLFGGWKPSGQPAAPVTIPPAPARSRTQIFLVDRPDASQSLITASYPAPEKSMEREPSLVAMNLAFGGSFNSRVNMNLREEKHWSYGARSGFSDTKGARQFTISTSVQTDQTAPAMGEIRKEIQRATKIKPFTQEELDRSIVAQTVGFGSSWETNSAVLGYVTGLVALGLPDTYYAEYPKLAKRLALQEIRSAAPVVMNPDAMLWLIVGDLKKIAPSIRDLRWGDVTVLDTDGKVVP